MIRLHYIFQYPNTWCRVMIHTVRSKDAPASQVMSYVIGRNGPNCGACRNKNMHRFQPTPASLMCPVAVHQHNTNEVPWMETLQKRWATKTLSLLEREVCLQRLYKPWTQRYLKVSCVLKPKLLGTYILLTLELPPGSEIRGMSPHGASFWTRTARIDTGLDGARQSYFLKVSA